MKRRLWLSNLAAAIVCCATGAFASGSPNVSIPERARGSNKVVVAKVATITPQWRTNSFGDRLIVSEVSLDVEETLKGRAAGSLWLDLVGGTLDGFTLKVSSLPEMKPGERAVCFLDAIENGWHVPHLKGLGILKLDDNNQIRDSTLRLDAIRSMVRTVAK